MNYVCPTVTTNDPHIYRLQLKEIDFASRIHIDIADGEFAPKLIDPSKIWWPHHIKADIHMMFKRPMNRLTAVIAKHPQLVIVHAEAEGEFGEIAEQLHGADIKAGVALLPETPVSTISAAIGDMDHVLLFSGHLGHFGGHADMELLKKAEELRELKPDLEIGWDGGINDHNISRLAEAGINVFNAGGFIHGAENSQAAYDKLKRKI